MKISLYHKKTSQMTHMKKYSKNEDNKYYNEYNIVNLKEFTKSQIVFTDSYISLLRFFEAVLQNCEIMTVKCINVFSVCLPDRMFV